MRHGFISNRPATNWEEGLICGNGTIGTCAFSRPWDETVIVTHERMWLPSGNPVLPAETGPRLFEIRRLIDQGLYHQASQLAFDISGQEGFMYPDPFAPVGDLSIKTDSVNGGYSDYKRTVDFRSGEATVNWSNSDGMFVRRMFVSRAHNVAVIKLTGPAKGALDCQLSFGPRQPGDGMDAKKIANSYARFNSLVKDTQTQATDTDLIYSCTFTKAWPGSVQKLLSKIKVINTGGISHKQGNTVVVTNADTLLLLVGVELLYEPGRDGAESLNSRLDAASGTYEELLASHAKLHSRLFDRVSLNLGGSEHDRPVEELLEESTGTNLNITLLEKEFDAGRHNIISSTGELPPALQGIWGGTHVADWAGDFTHNGNVPSAIAAMLMGNTPELMLSYTQYLEFLVPYMEMNAKRMFDARGIVLPSRTSTHGFNNALSPNFPGGFWIGGAAWAAHFFYDYWLYTGDKEFLKEHAMPFMEKVGLFFEDFLYEGPDGKYIFSPCQSPENTPANSNDQASFNATMDVAAAKELLENLICASQELDTNADKIPFWQQMLTKMPDYMIDDNGMLKEWLTPKLENNDHHRHSSHLYPLYDGLPDEIAQSYELQSAFRKTIRYKLDKHWSDNAVGFMSFGLVQLGQAAASLGDGELAYECLVHLANRFWLNNLASMHNHKCLLNMDISGGMPSVLIKMLVTSDPGSITLMPALPKVWAEGTIEGVLCRGQIEVKHLSWNSGQIEVTLVSGCDQAITLKTPTLNKEQKVTLTAGQEMFLHIKSD